MLENRKIARSLENRKFRRNPDNHVRLDFLFSPKWKIPIGIPKNLIPKLILVLKLFQPGIFIILNRGHLLRNWIKLA